MVRLIEDGWGQDNPAFRQLVTSLMWPGANPAQMQSFNHLQRMACSPLAAATLQRRITATSPARDSLLPDEASFEQEIRFATTHDGVRIAYAISGNGTPLVRAPHWMTHLDWDWRSAAFGARIRAFARRNRLLRYDERGQGLSDRDVEPGTLDECVADMEAVVDAAGWQRFALFAASGGSPIAIRYAARHPERVSRLMLVGAYARGARVRGVSPEHLDAFQRLLKDGWGEANPAFRQMMTTQLWPAATAQQMQSFGHLQRVTCSAESAAKLVRKRTELDASGDLPLIRCPTLVLHSPHDAAVPFEEGRMIAATVREARFEPFDSPNHTPLAGEPAFEQVLRLIDVFLREGDGAAARPALRAVGRGSRRPGLIAWTRQQRHAVRRPRAGTGRRPCAVAGPENASGTR